MDAYSAAQAIASGRATGIPKSRDGIVESIRCLQVARRSAVKAKTQCINQIRAMVVNRPGDLREQMRPLTTGRLIQALSWVRPGTDVSNAAAGRKMALRSFAHRHTDLTQEIKDRDIVLARLTARAAPELRAKIGVGVGVAAQLLVTAGDNPERLRSEGSFAHLTGAPPTRRHRGEPIGTDSTVAETAALTTPSRRSRWSV